MIFFWFVLNFMDTKIVPILEGNDDVKEVIVNCTQFVREQMNQDEVWLTHQLFGKKEASKWPKKTDLCCYHCTEPFDTIPIPLPQSYNSSQQLYAVYGVVCSGNCGKAFIIENEPMITNQRMGLFNQMIRDVFQLRGLIRPAFPRMRLRKFGGDLDIMAFRRGFVHGSCELLMFPFVPSPCVFALRNDSTTKKNQITTPSSSASFPPSSTSSSLDVANNTNLFVNFCESKKQKVSS